MQQRSSRENSNLVPKVTIHTIMKRSFDILVAATALLLLSPVFMLIALAIRLESKGSIFYIAKRAGRGLPDL